VHFLVATGTEGLVAGTAEDHGVDRLFFVGQTKGLDQLLDGLTAEGVEDLRPVDGDAHRIGAHFVEDVLERLTHGVDPVDGSAEGVDAGQISRAWTGRPRR
jgi:hypothetical protein